MQVQINYQGINHLNVLTFINYLNHLLFNEQQPYDDKHEELAMAKD